MRKDGLEILLFIGHNEGKLDGGKQRVAYLTSLCMLLAEKGV